MSGIPLLSSFGTPSIITTKAYLSRSRTRMPVSRVCHIGVQLTATPIILLYSLLVPPPPPSNLQ